MTHEQLPDRRIDIPVHTVERRLDEVRDIDRRILEELQARPVTTAYVAARIDEQPGYVSQRLSMMNEEGILEQLGRGFYEVSPRVVNGHER